MTKKKYQRYSSEFKSERGSLSNWCESKTEDELLAYRTERNALSLDGLPGLDVESM